MLSNRVGRSSPSQSLASRTTGSITFVLRSSAKHDRPLLGAVGGRGDDRNHLPMIGQAHPQREAAVGTQFDRLAADRDVRVGLGHAVQDHLGVDFQLEQPAAGEEGLGPFAVAGHQRRTHRAAEPLLEQLLQLLVGPFGVVAAAHGVDLVEILGHAGPVLVDDVARARRGGRDDVAARDREEPATGGQIADLDPIVPHRPGRCADTSSTRRRES